MADHSGEFESAIFISPDISFPCEFVGVKVTSAGGNPEGRQPFQSSVHNPPDMPRTSALSMLHRKALPAASFSGP